MEKCGRYMAIDMTISRVWIRGNDSSKPWKAARDAIPRGENSQQQNKFQRRLLLGKTGQISVPALVLTLSNLPFPLAAA
jgi:hypothetical protein